MARIDKKKVGIVREGMRGETIESMGEPETGLGRKRAEAVLNKTCVAHVCVSRCTARYTGLERQQLQARETHSMLAVVKVAFDGGEMDGGEAVVLRGDA